MKTQKLVPFIALLAVVSFFSSKESLRKNDVITENEIKIKELRDSIVSYNLKEVYVKNKLDSIKIEELKVCEVIKSNIEPYNPDVKIETVQNFVNTMSHFKIGSNEKDFKTLLSQLLYESGFQQYYSSRHPTKAGQLVVSHSNAIGLCQIVPNTAYLYLRIAKNKGQLDELKDLGCDNLEIVNGFNHYLPNDKQREIVTKWLTSEKNNIILWGYIMNEILLEEGDYSSTLVAYNAGSGYLNKYLKNGNDPNVFDYVVKIKSISKKIFV